jgi:UDP-2-acetamido-2,6-beta-L-arabino-hexul-4-ose reductase
VKQILITGAKGFVGRNLITYLNSTHDLEMLEFDVDNSEADLIVALKRADLVFHFAGIFRPANPNEFKHDIGLTEKIINCLRTRGEPVPIVFSSSIQALRDNSYGANKRATEQLIFSYGRDLNVPVYVFRFPNLFGKWGKPDYSVVSKFCYNLTRELPIEVGDSDITLAYIDDVVDSLVKIVDQQFTNIDADGYCLVEPVYSTSVPKVAEILSKFLVMRAENYVPDDRDQLEKKLYATWLSFCPPELLRSKVPNFTDPRGSFATLIKDSRAGQFAVNITSPGETKGNHFHRTKIERFVLVKGQAIFRLLDLRGTEVQEIELDDTNLETIEIPPGVVHNFTNTGTEDCVFFIWASEVYDPERPDTIPYII